MELVKVIWNNEVFNVVRNQGASCFVLESIDKTGMFVASKKNCRVISSEDDIQMTNDIDAVEKAMIGAVDE
jgi:hypothetical protein